MSSPENSPVPPDLTIRLTPTLTLPNPLVAASGTYGYGTELTDLTDYRALGALITPTITVAPRAGNPMPRTVETSAGLLHATGLPNPGLNAFRQHILPQSACLPCPLIVSIAADTRHHWERLAADLTADGGIAALELNLTPLSWQTANAANAMQREQQALCDFIEEAITTVRAATALPLIAKLPSEGADIGVLAQTAAEAGADVLAVGQAFPGSAVRVGSRAFRLPGAVGGLSGPCIKPLALYQVWRVAQAVSLPILGGGGIMTVDDALEFILAGATAVSIGTASFIHPSTIARLRTDLIASLTASGLSDLSALIGAA